MKDKKGQVLAVGDYVVDKWNDLSKIISFGDDDLVISKPIVTNSIEYRDDDSDTWMLSGPAIIKIEESEAIIFTLKGVQC